MALGNCTTKLIPGNFFRLETPQDLVDCFVVIMSMDGYHAQLDGNRDSAGNVTGELRIDGPAGGLRAGIGNVLVKYTSQPNISKYETWELFLEDHDVS